MQRGEFLFGTVSQMLCSMFLQQRSVRFTDSLYSELFVLKEIDGCPPQSGLHVIMRTGFDFPQQSNLIFVVETHR